MFGKPIRIVNKKLLAEVKTRPCAACGSRPVDPHHIVSRGAGGSDVPENLIPLCRIHHRLIHDKGINYMCQLFPQVKIYLQIIGYLSLQ